MPAFSQTLTGIAVNPQGSQTSATIQMNGVVAPPKIFAISEDQPRIVVDFAQASPSLGGKTLPNGQRQLPGVGHIKAIRYASRGESGIRVVFDLVDQARILDKSISSAEVFLSIAGPDLKKSVQTAPQLPAVPKPKPALEARVEAAPNVPVPRLNPRRSALPAKPARKPVIVIDAGHGGYDPGALGKKGTKEKDITMAAAKELSRQLTATGRYTVMLTRGKDIYIKHEERLRIARSGGADLFISIHADSAGNAKARGASVYTLADRAKNRSRKIINSQNWIMDVDLTQQSDPVGDILVDLAQRNTQSQSDKFATILIKELGTSTHLIGNSHRRAGYFVLLAPDVPAVLLELGFLSNRKDEVLLKNTAHRKKMMTSVQKAINRYFDAQKS